MELSVDDLAEATARFARGVAAADAGAPVASCPGWTVADLVHHLGDVHAWAGAAVRGGGEPPGAGTGPPPSDGLAGWYARRAAALVEALIEAGPGAPAWVFAPAAGVGTAAFWVRRQVHETVLHTHDLRTADGDGATLDPAVAWDGLEEVRDALYPRQVTLGRTSALPVALTLVATDLDRTPVVLGEGPPVLVRGPAAELLLRVWHRAAPRPESEDPRVAALLTGALTP